LKKNLPILLLVLGLLLVVGAGVYAFLGSFPAPAASSAPSGPVVAAAPGEVPQTMADLPLASSQAGLAALDSLQQLHQEQIPLVSGVMAVYGDKNATLWVAETASEAEALKLVQAMETAIANGSSPLKPVGVFQFRKRDVYYLESPTSTDFYMQSGKKVLWVSTTSELAEKAMTEMLDFYP